MPITLSGVFSCIWTEEEHGMMSLVTIMMSTGSNSYAKSSSLVQPFQV